MVAHEIDSHYCAVVPDEDASDGAMASPEEEPVSAQWTSTGRGADPTLLPPPADQDDLNLDDFLAEDDLVLTQSDLDEPPTKPSKGPMTRSRHLTKREQSLGGEFSMRVDKDGAMDASAGERSTRVELGDEAEAEIVELTPREDDADRHPKLRPIPKGDVNGETVLVIPYTINAGEPALLVPAQEDAVLGMATAAGGCVEAAERAIRATLPNSGGVTGFAAGADEDGARLVVVAMEGEPKSVARTAARRPKGILAGAATLWCTLAALTAPSWQSQIASLAVATASHSQRWTDKRARFSKEN